ncbi:MAG: hypothetical protein IPM11_00540 [Micropruina sp.]|nr:hypothetical protein [Micropruina sp.]
MSQKPSAADAVTGPNMRETTREKAATPATVAQGSNVRAVTHEFAVQEALVDCALRTAFTIMAPIMTMLKTAT